MAIYILFSAIFGVFLWRNREFSHPFQVMIVTLLVVSWVFLGIAFIIYMNINSRGRISTGTLVVASVRAVSSISSASAHPVSSSSSLPPVRPSSACSSSASRSATR